MTTIAPRSTSDAARAAALRALDEVRPAVSELGTALAALRDALPAEQRADAERAFMNAFGNAVVCEARRSSVGAPAAG